MRPFRITLLALSAALLLSAAPAAQAADLNCDLAPFPTLGNIHRFVGEPVTYDVVNNDTRWFDAFIEWGDVSTGGDFPGLYPGDELLFSHTYTTPGSYSPVLYIHVADPTPDGTVVCKASFAIGTVRVTRRHH